MSTPECQRNLSAKSTDRPPCASRQATGNPCCRDDRSALEGSRDPITSNLYDAAQEGEVPDTAIKASLGLRQPHCPCRIETR